MDTVSTFHTLCSSGLFENLYPPLVARIKDLGQEILLPAAQKIYDEGEAAGPFYILLAGKLNCVFAGRSGAVTLDMLVEPGSCFGMERLMSRSARMLSVMAVSQTRLFVLDGEALLTLLEENEASRALERLRFEVNREAKMIPAPRQELPIMIESQENIGRFLSLIPIILSRKPQVPMEAHREMALHCLRLVMRANAVILFCRDDRSDRLTPSVAALDGGQAMRRLVDKNTPLPCFLETMASKHSVILLDTKKEGAGSDFCQSLAVQGMVWMELLQRPAQQGRASDYLVLFFRDGPARWSAVHASMIRSIGEMVVRELETCHDPLHWAGNDELTGVPNLALFQMILSKSAVRARRNGCGFAVLFVDIDRFSLVNDSLGFAEGDRLLREVAKRLQKTIRDADTVGRSQGDCFLVLLDDLNRPRETLVAAQKILEAMRKPFPVPGREPVGLRVSIGAAASSADQMNVDELLRMAKEAQATARQGGGDRYHYYIHDHLAPSPRNQMELEQKIRQALQQGQFAVYYQPQIRIKDQEIVGAEALVRWNEPGGELVSPGVFLPLMEENGLIVPLSEWILEEASHQCLRWPDTGVEIRIAINVTGRWLLDKNFAQRVINLLERAPALAGNLELELTEEILLHDAESSIAVLERLRSCGVEIALDDFGTGHSSLSYLRHLPIDIVKLDQSFVRGVCQQGHDAAIVSAMTELAHTIGLRVVAEGVETIAQYEFLSRIGCDIAQGYLISRPQSKRDFLEWLAKPALSELPVSAATNDGRSVELH